MLGKKLQSILEQQFYGFLNLALRNPWLFTEEQRPAHVRVRASQINSFLKNMGLLTSRFYDDEWGVIYIDMRCQKDSGELKCNTERARELRDLLGTLAYYFDRRSLKKLAETNGKNMKLFILECMKYSMYSFSICDFKSLSYRRRIHRVLRVLVELKLVSKINKEYHLTDLGAEISEKIRRARRRWVDLQIPLLLYYFKSTQIPPRAETNNAN